MWLSMSGGQKVVGEAMAAKSPGKQVDVINRHHLRVSQPPAAHPQRKQRNQGRPARAAQMDAVTQVPRTPRQEVVVVLPRRRASARSRSQHQLAGEGRRIELATTLIRETFAVVT